jgi:Lar family restriction alleviation protein
MTAKKPERLEPCPFCGREALGPTKHKGTYGFMCSHCGCRVDRYEVPSDAFEAWNRRAPTPTDEAELLKRAQDIYTDFSKDEVQTMTTSIRLLWYFMDARAKSPAQPSKEAAKPSDNEAKLTEAETRDYLRGYSAAMIDACELCGPNFEDVPKRREDCAWWHYEVPGEGDRACGGMELREKYYQRFAAPSIKPGESK